jgi:signal transduction histidine kinase
MRPRIAVRKPRPSMSRRLSIMLRQMQTCVLAIRSLTAELEEHKHKQEQLKRQMDSLGHMHAELARASRATLVRQLMATIAHEINQPLTALVANAGAARRWLAGRPARIGKTRQALTRIVRDGNRASEIIARTRALIGGAETQRDLISLNTVIQDVLVLMRSDLRKSGITPRLNLDENLPAVSCDRVQMQQVLLNLIANAIDAMNEVAPRARHLTISTSSRLDAVLVTVEDRGIGLKKGQLERIFEPFYTTKPHGMGIGLALSRTIIEAHGGHLWAAPNKRAGATFRFQLPLNGTYVG